MVPITIAIVYHNEEHKLQGLLDSLAKQTLSLAETSLLLVNNASTDGSEPVIDKWCQQNSGFAVQKILRTKNHMAEARQQAVDLTKTPWIVFLDADGFVHHDWYEQLQKSLGQLKESVAACGGWVKPLATQPWHKYILPLINSFPMEKQEDQKVYVNHLPTNNCAFRKAAIDQVGGFDFFYERVGEDLDLSTRLRQKSSILYDPSFVFEHEIPSHQTQWYTKMAYYGRAQSYVLLRQRRGVPVVKFFPLMLLCTFVMIISWLPQALLLFLVAFLLSPRVRILGMSFLFYGLGELVGAFLLLLQMPFLWTAPRSTPMITGSKGN